MFETICCTGVSAFIIIITVCRLSGAPHKCSRCWRREWAIARCRPGCGRPIPWCRRRRAGPGRAARSPALAPTRSPQSPTLERNWFIHRSEEADDPRVGGHWRRLDAGRQRDWSPAAIRQPFSGSTRSNSVCLNRQLWSQIVWFEILEHNIYIYLI